jgi:hypothetical protein
MDAARRRQWVFTFSRCSNRLFASAAYSVAVIRIEPPGFSRSSVMAVSPSLDLLKARAYRWKQAFGGLRWRDAGEDPQSTPA